MSSAHRVSRNRKAGQYELDKGSKERQLARCFYRLLVVAHDAPHKVRAVLVRIDRNRAPGHYWRQIWLRVQSEWDAPPIDRGRKPVHEWMGHSRERLQGLIRLLPWLRLNPPGGHARFEEVWDVLFDRIEFHRQGRPKRGLV
jgi:hypothetical protein